MHQMGWRLGGKGATGRNLAVANRVEEHGIHLFGNMYANSLHMIYDALGELGRAGDMDTDFAPSNFQLVSDFFQDRWHGFEGWLPSDDDKPWLVSADHGSLKDIWQGIWNTVVGITDPGLLPPPPAAATSGVHANAAVAPSAPASAADDGWIEWLEELLATIDAAIQKLEKALPRGSDELDKLIWQFVQVDLLTACLRGTIDEQILLKGIDSIDGVPYRDWLTRNRLHPRTLSSSLLQAIPNTCMQYPDGDTTGFPQMSAAAYLTFVLRQMAAPGQAAYFFRVSTGETVILPLYQVLMKRGVRFEFFSRITNLVPSSDGSRIARIERRRQATLNGPKGTRYNPLVSLPGGQWGWPNQPLYEQLVEGPRLKAGKIDLESWWADWPGEVADINLNAGDLVIVALPPAAQAVVCAQAAAAAKDPAKRWQGMLANVRTCATQAVQIWLDKTTTELGWPDLTKHDPRVTTNRCLGPTFANPLSAFADFTSTLASESWYAADSTNKPGGVVSEVNSLDFGLLHCFSNDATTRGENRFEQQYYRANIDPNERYTISFPGTLKYRPSPWQSGYANVVLSSDAVFTGFNIGSFEGAVMSGMLASYAVTNRPTTDQILGYGFCRPHPPKTDDPMLGG